jgi:hypothetical protein
MRRTGTDWAAEVDADVGDGDDTGECAPRLEHQPGLARREGHGARGAHRRAGDLAGEAVDPRGDVDRDHRNAARVEALRDVCGIALQLAPEAGAVHRVDRHVGSGQFPVERGVVDSGSELEHGDPHAPRAQRVRGDEPVAAVVALAAHHDRALPVATAEDVAHLPGNGAPGARHQQRDRRSRRNGAPVGFPHRLGCDEQFHDPIASPLAQRHRDGHRGGLGVGE